MAGLPTGPAVLVLAVCGLTAAGAGYYLQAGKSQPAPVLDKAAIDKVFPPDGSHNFTIPASGSYKLPALKAAGDGDVLTIEGKPARLKSFMTGKITVVSFIYTLCNEERGCPYLMGKLFDIFHASEDLAGLAGNVQMITLSFDPVRDTPKAMAAYASPALAGPDRDKKMKWTFLTTRSKKQLSPILKAYGQTIGPVNDDQSITHLLRVYLVDAKGQVRNIYGLGFLDPRLLFTDIQTLMMEQGLARQEPSS